MTTAAITMGQVIDMAKRGRPRKTGQRHPGGKLVQGRDRGVTRLQYERVALAGEKDPGLVVTPLGLMFANGIITDEQHRAGQEFARCARIALDRRTEISAVDMAGLSRGADNSEGEEGWRRKASERYREARALLGRESSRQRETVENVCLYERTPRWLQPRHPRAIRPSDIRDADELVAGLDALAELFGIVQPKARVA